MMCLMSPSLCLSWGGEVCDVESIPVRTDLLEYDRNGNILRHARQRGTESVVVSDTCDFIGNRLSLCRQREIEITDT